MEVLDDLKSGKIAQNLDISRIVENSIIVTETRKFGKIGGNYGI